MGNRDDLMLAIEEVDRQFNSSNKFWKILLDYCDVPYRLPRHKFLRFSILLPPKSLANALLHSIYKFQPKKYHKPLSPISITEFKKNISNMQQRKVKRMQK